MRSKPCLTLEDVRKLAAACEAEAAHHTWIVTIALVGGAGSPPPPPPQPSW